MSPVFQSSPLFIHSHRGISTSLEGYIGAQNLIGKSPGKLRIQCHVHPLESVTRSKYFRTPINFY